jgi:uncharacterized protein
MPESTPRGRFVWHELMTTNPDSAQSFYTEVIGWGTQQWEGSTTPYTMWTANGTPLGGVMRLPDEVAAAGSPPHWLAYVSTPDVDATAAQVTDLGGRIMVPPTDIPSVGRFAVFTDPQGAMLAAFTPAGETPGHDGAPRQGEFSWHELTTTDYEAAFSFYNALFGWEKTSAIDMGPMGIYQMYGRNGMALGGMFNKTADMPMPPNWLNYTMVADVHSAAEKVKRLGGQVLNGPMEVPGGDWIVQCMDPQGAAFALHSPPASRG